MSTRECRSRFRIGQVVKVIRALEISWTGVRGERHGADDSAVLNQAKGTKGVLRRVVFDTLGVHFYVELAFRDKMILMVRAVIRRTKAGETPTIYEPASTSTATGNGVSTDPKGHEPPPGDSSHTPMPGER
jgi:hypothetical protein